MPQRDIVVIGGSAGSIAPLMEIVRVLPASFPATVLVVVHRSADSESNLDAVLSREGPLPASQPADGQEICPGQIYVARPDFHLTVEPGRVRVQKGPRENRHRPAIDPLFRTAARVYGSRVIGVILSGQFDDGAAGLYAVKQRGGIAMVQDPAEATFGDMPRQALSYATPDYVLKTHDISSVLVNLVETDQSEIAMSTRRSRKPASSQPAAGMKGVEKEERNLTAAYFDEGEGNPSVFACPECHGVLWELKDGNLVHFRCRVGHAYGMDSLAKELSQGSEAALWAAMRALEEKAAMQRRIADGLAAKGKSAARLREQSAADTANARVIREIIFGHGAELERQEKEEQRKKTA